MKPLVVKEYRGYYRVLYLLVTIVIVSTVSVGDVGFGFAMLVIGGFLHHDWQNRNHKNKTKMIRIINELACRSYTEFLMTGSHLFFKVSTIIENEKGTQADLAVAFSDFMDRECLYISSVHDNANGNTYSEVYALKTNPYNVVFKTKDEHRKVNLDSLVFVFNEKAAKSIYERTALAPKVADNSKK